MDPKQDAVTLVVNEPSRSWMASCLDVDTATTLIALISDDPADWEEALSVWPRYRTPAVCEFASILPIEQVERDAAMAALSGADAWVVIDFCDKRIFTGGQFMPVQRDAAFAMVVDEGGDQHSPLSVHLPPWWELHEGAARVDVNQARQSAIKRPHVDRDVLYGPAFLHDLATRVLQVVTSDSWRDSAAASDEQARYPFTIGVHRDWLMTPRDDLSGRMPRELLHGAREWSDRVTWGQRIRFEDGAPLVGLPDDWADYDTAPMGSQEMCLYFDLCRELINAGWSWCETEPGRAALESGELAIKQLAQFLGKVQDDWLAGSYEGGSSPRLTIECDRRRVPQGSGVEIEGIDEVPSEQHVADCDCPICEMMADGIFGVGFSSIDGHHLELDDEFAFSMCETRADWEQERYAFEDFRAETDREWAEREATGQSDDPFSSAWSGIIDDGPLPGDPGGQLKMAFMVAEIVADLERAGAARADIQSLNECFGNYRRCDHDRCGEQAVEFKANLQSLAERYPDLISKSADLQSRIDEAQRSPAPEDGDFGPAS